MGRSKLTDDTWDALFAEEAAGVPRKVLAPKYGVSLRTICAQAQLRHLTKRETGTADHRKRPPGGWPDDEPLKQSAHGMTPRRWRELLARYQAGESAMALSLEYGPSVGAIHTHAARIQMRKSDSPDSVYNWCNGRDGAGRAFEFNPEDPAATEASLTERARAAAAEGRIHDFVALEKGHRASRRWCGTVGSALSPDPDADDDPPPPITLRTAQRPPEGAWSTWLFLGGRGAGKTLAGASWLADQAELLGAGGRLALVGPTLHDVREVMIEGPSGLRSLPRWTRATRPAYEPSRRRLVFANGCIAHAFSAEDPDSLRGPQFSAAWADEFCAWPAVGARGAGETLALLRMGLRRPLGRRDEGRGTRGGGNVEPVPSDALAGAASSPLDPRPSTLDAPRLVVTTTPRPTRALVSLRDEPSCKPTHAGTADNAAHLSPGFLDELRALYGGTRREAQEIEGRIVDLDGALFTAEMMVAARDAFRSPSNASFRGRKAEPGTQENGAVVTTGSGGEAAPLGSGSALRASRNDGDFLDPASNSPKGDRPLDRVIVALDPTATATGDACGIIVAGSRRRPDGVREAVILADRSVRGVSPDQWARRAVQAARDFDARAMVAEVNQGGDMVRAVLKTAGCGLRIREVRASKGKRVRAEPVAALYEQGRVRHAPADGVPLSALEEELMAFAGELDGTGSLDRADALVWAVTDLLIDAPDGDRGPRVTWL